MTTNINNKNKKKILDARIPDLIRNGLQTRQRSFIIMVGDKSRDQIPNLHYLMMNTDLKMNKSILWAYKKKLLGFTSHRKKREHKIKKDIKRGRREANELDPFEAFISNQQIRYVYYKESDKILGNTYGMLVLQDFEGLTPNLMARTIETVEGGGIIVMLLKSLQSLKQLYAMTMDVHSRYRTEAHNDVVARFNERFLLSLADCKTCLVLDDSLNVLPISGARGVKKLPPKDDDEISAKQQELNELKESLADTQPAGSLVALSKTANQAQSILRFIDAIAEKTFNTTVTLTAGRGRGKSAALGISIAAAIAQDYSNIFVTSPSPENLKTLFEFVFKALDAMEYVEHQDYDIIQSTNPSFHKSIVRVDVKKAGHRQTIQYILPTDSHVLGQAELVIIDEAAAIPLPVVKKLLGPYLVFMASTINGYEGTGRSLSLKLISQLRKQAKSVTKEGADGHQYGEPTFKRTNDDENDLDIRARNLVEVTLDEPIRYAPGDPVESWLGKLLCLDVKLSKNTKYATRGCPHPSECSLFCINRDTLFSYDPVSEAFLQKMMALFVSSHYKNSPNDLQLMSDAPAHQLYALFGPDVGKDASIPTPLCVIQLALEGEISRESIRRSLSRGIRAGGDLIPWLVSQQFQDDDFASLSGARIVRIATHPDYQDMGYGSRAIELLSDYFEGKFTDVNESNNLDNDRFSLRRLTDEELAQSSLKDEISPRKEDSLPPLFINLAHKAPYYLHYMGVSYGLTRPLLKFWKKGGYSPVYLRQTPNGLTGEYTCVMLKVLPNRKDEWLQDFARDFHKRFLSLLSYSFRAFPSVQALSVIESTRTGGSIASSGSLSKSDLDVIFSPFDLKRLESYANNLLDYHVILDLVPHVSNLYFEGKLADGVRLSHVQRAILLSVGLQRKEIDDVARELKIEPNQSMAMFAKVMRKVSGYLHSIIKESISGELPEVETKEDVDNKLNNVEDMERELEEDLNTAGKEAVSEVKEKQRELINSLKLDKYVINDFEDEWKSNKTSLEKAAKRKGTVSLKSGKKRKPTETAEDIYKQEMTSLQNEKKKRKAKK
ncbi:killer toxin resistant protein [Brettanomyces nanus]|uniref:RNA cytidine acetyltransferase n=1 Tax=Eeniella nana TaxID=13502 RepID=A0A875S8L3_EENNA|nr:killer toxin resistant protein [Brettanomyces nanus]QPG76232.1 killer toxin resistant protein [Brettanomyces nanus]